MSFGIAAFNSKDKLDEGKTLITYEQARDIIRNIMGKNMEVSTRNMGTMMMTKKN